MKLPFSAAEGPAAGHIAGACLAGFLLRLYFIVHFPFGLTGDAAVYDQLARNWLDQGVYGLPVNGQLAPIAFRLPGYPAFLAAVYGVFGGWPDAPMIVQAQLDLITCVLAGLLAVRFVPEPDAASRRRAANIALWLAALCPFTANYTAVLLTETLTTLLTALALIVFIDAYMAAPGEVHSRVWFAGGLVAGLATLLRPESPLLVLCAGLLLLPLWWRPRDWRKLIAAGMWMALGLVLPLLPWAARNWRTFHTVQFLAPRYAEMPGEYVTRGFFAWTATWLAQPRYAYESLWKLDSEPIDIDKLPPSAFDSPEERARVAELLRRHNQDTTLPPELDAQFAEIARERTERRPLRTYLWVPLQRVAAIWLTSRTELLPVSGELGPIEKKWDEDRPDFIVSAGFAVLNVLYLLFAAIGCWRFRDQRALLLPLVYIAARTLLLTRMEVPEPRYVLVVYPVIMAFVAQAFLPAAE